MNSEKFDAWIDILNEVRCRAHRSAKAFQAMDISDINGTPMVASLLEDLESKIESVTTQMEKAREQAT